MDRRNIGIVATLVLGLLTLAQANAQHQQPMQRDPNAGYLGVKLGPVSEDLQKQLKLEGTAGIVVLELLPDSPAEKSGIKKFDLILKVDGKDVEDVEDFVGVMEGSKPGQQVQFSVMREGKMQDVAVTLGTRPAEFGKDHDQDDDHDHDKSPTTKPGK